MSSVFEAYDSEFNSLSQELNKKLNDYKNYGGDIGNFKIPLSLPPLSSFLTSFN